LAKGGFGLEQVFEGTKAPSLDRRDIPAVLISAVIWIGLLLMPMVLVFVEAFRVGDGFGLENFANLGTQGARDLLNITMLDAGLNSLRNMLVAGLHCFPLGNFGFLAPNQNKVPFR
jgi:ABC-type sulfate transport system permease subunit